MNRNLEPGYWDSQWGQNVKKFPKYTMNKIYGLIPYGSSVLDIGCGDGSFLLRLKNNLGCHVYGVDISEVAIAKMKTLGIEGSVENAEELRIRGKWDITVATHIYEHIEKDDNLAKTQARLTRQFALIAVPNDCSYPEPTGEHVRKYTVQTLSDLLSPYYAKIENHTLGNHIIFKCVK